jgi:hypothetical protein
MAIGRTTDRSASAELLRRHPGHKRRGNCDRRSGGDTAHGRFVVGPFRRINGRAVAGEIGGCTPRHIQGRTESSCPITERYSKESCANLVPLHPQRLIGPPGISRPRPPCSRNDSAGAGSAASGHHPAKRTRFDPTADRRAAGDLTALREPLGRTLCAAPAAGVDRSCRARAQAVAAAGRGAASAGASGGVAARWSVVLGT